MSVWRLVLSMGIYTVMTTEPIDGVYVSVYVLYRKQPVM